MSDPEIDQLKKDIHLETYFSFLFQNVGVRLRHIFSSQFFKQSLFKQHCKEDKYRTQSKIHFFMIKRYIFSAQSYNIRYMLWNPSLSHLQFFQNHSRAFFCGVPWHERNSFTLFVRKKNSLPFFGMDKSLIELCLP